MREEGEVGGRTDFLVVNLDPKIILDEGTALVATAMQLQASCTHFLNPPFEECACSFRSRGRCVCIPVSCPQVTAPNLAKKCNNFCDGLRYLLHLLRRTRPGVEGEARREAQAQPVLFVLHDFEGCVSPSHYSTIDTCANVTRLPASPPVLSPPPHSSWRNLI